MTHDLAVNKQTATRYLLGELSHTERDEFEEHYFDCAECACDVRAGASLRANVRAVLSERPASAKSAAVQGERWWQRLFSVRGPVLAPYAVAAVLAVVTAWQGLIVIPGLKPAGEPQLIVGAAIPPSVRGSEQSIAVPRNARSFQVTLDVNDTSRFAAYECVVLRGNGSPMFSVTEPSGPVRPESLHLLLPAARFETGEYVVVLRGQRDGSAASPVEIDRYRFAIERR